MILNLLTVILLLALIGLFVWLASRAWRARNPVVRILGGILTSLLALAVIAVTAVGLFGFYKMNIAPYQYQKANIQVQASPEALARGEKAAGLCADCHSSTGKVPLDGSKANFIEGGPPMGQLWAPNLTPAGPLKDWTDGEIVRAIREGVDKNGRPLIIMPSQGLHAMSDQDAQGIVAYLRSQPAVDHLVPERDLNLLAALFLGAGMFPTSAQLPILGPVAHPQANTPEYGLYITNAYGCRDCHGPNLEGSSGAQNGPPPAPVLAGVVANWKEEGLLKVFREGVDPTGHQLSDGMPWKAYGNMFTDQELKDLYSYLKSLPPAQAVVK